MTPPEDPRPAEPVGTQPPFGTRLLAALRAEGLPLGKFDYRAIQSLKAADREETIRLLRAEQPLLGYRAIRLLREREPEEVAERMAREAREAATFLALLLF